MTCDILMELDIARANVWKVVKEENMSVFLLIIDDIVTQASASSLERICYDENEPQNLLTIILFQEFKSYCVLFLKLFFFFLRSYT